MQSTIRKRLQALEEQAGQNEEPGLLIIGLYGNSTEPPAELLAEAKRQAKAKGYAFGVVGCSGEGEQPWEIWP